ncbi:hypothetical protein C8J57DRAFT_1670165 [Mycena rebaudengoi]|nr:hypothetical protein C8J57DRAFT_1670165 [Mycena rebaudengoi]
MAYSGPKRATGLIVSPLKELRDAFKEGTDAVFKPKHTISCKPVTIAFACNDTRLLSSSSPAAQILPNPSNEAELAQLVAIVRVDGTAQMLNMQMESRGAWAGTDFESTLVAASWSPKGKQLAIGLRAGDILTFGLTNNAQPLKHIPATAASPLVSLNWVGPAFTFRTSYGSNTGDPPHHIVSFDTRSNTATFIQLIHPFPLSGRSPNAQILVLPRWDQDPNPPASEDPKSLLVVGDAASTDLEVLGNAGARWFQQSQENPLTVPLDKNDEDTFLLTLDVDLTDEMPIMYAYLNDGTVQGWYVTHPESKPYAGLVKAAQPSPVASAFGQPATTASAFGQQSTSAFSPPSTSAFGQPSAFGQAQTTSAFGQPSAFAQQPAFGQSAFVKSAAPSPSPFALRHPLRPPAEASPPSPPPTAHFGAAASNSPDPPPPLTSTPSISMGEVTPSAFGGLSLGGSSDSNSQSDDKPRAVGGGMFGSSPSPLPLPPNHPANQPSPATPSAFGGTGVVKPAAGFGAFGAVSSGAFGNPNSNAFGGGGGAFSGGAFGGGSSNAGDSKPAASGASPAFGKSGFGQSGFGQTGFGAKPVLCVWALGLWGGCGCCSGDAACERWGRVWGICFGWAHGESAFGGGASPSTAGGGGFGAFASKPTGFPGASTGSAFGGGGNSSAFGGAQSPASAFGNSSSTPPTTSTSAFGGFGTGTSAFGSTATPAAQPTSSSTPPPSSTSAFGGFGTATSVFGNKTPAAPPASTSSSPSSDKEIRSTSPNDSPPPKAATPLNFTTSGPPTTSGAFSNLRSSSSGFKPASGFGAFGSDSAPASSPFFNAAAQTKAPAVSAFGNLGSGASSTPTLAAAAGKPAFGAPSLLGGPKSAFAPISQPAAAKTTSAFSGGFSAFGGSPVGLASAATASKSFGELLKTGDEEKKPALKPAATSAFGPSGSLSKPKSPEETTIKPIPVFTPPPVDKEVARTEDSSSGKDQAATPSADGEKEGTTSAESSFGSLSQTSSFVEVEANAEDDADEDADGNEEEDDDDDDNYENAFLSDSFGSGSGSEAPDDEDDDEDASRSPSPSAVPLPPSRSPSSTPRAEVPKITVSPSPTPSEEESDSSEDSRLSTIREESTTPPGSPEKKERKPPSPKTAPVAEPIPIAPSPFGIGLGRPSTRPTRSSPLANAPVSGDEDAKAKPVEEAKPAAKAQPASPKPRFGVLPPVEADTPKAASSSKPTRPKTPPLSAFSFGAASKPAVKTPLAGPAASPSPPPTTPSPLSLPMPVLSSNNSQMVSAPSGPGSFFGFGTPKSAVIPSAASPMSMPTPMPAPKGFFSLQPAASSQSPSPVSTAPPPAPPPEAAMEEGMQKECAALFANMTRQLEDVRRSLVINFRLLAQAASLKRVELGKSAGGSRRAVDLGDRSKWALGDVVQFGQTMRMFEQDLAQLKEERVQREKLLRELQSNLLKAGTRREEIGKFIKAQHDKDFAKMLKARTLGPEHMETQTQLRRSIRTMQDRIQKLESHLQDSKKKLSRASAGNPGLRAPTLDTLNRTFRNMDIALDNQTSEVERLTARIAKLNTKDGQRSGHKASARDARLPDPVTRQRPLNVTPHVAVTTAAALNAERSAHKLKRALLAVRKEPLLNTQAASAAPAPLAFQTPQRAGPGIDLGLSGPSIPLRGLSLGLSTPPSSMPGFDLPEDNFNPSPLPAPGSRRGAGGGKTRISSSVPLKRTPGPPAAMPSPPPSFDWGPLPDFQNKPTVSRENSLGSSWVSDGFHGKK